MTSALQTLHTFHGAEGQYILFDPESMLFFQSDRETQQHINRLRKSGFQGGEAVSDAQLQHMEATLVKERARIAERYRKASTGTHVINRLTILTTTACNLNCTYCYAEGGAYGGAVSRLSAHNAQSAISNILKYYKGIKAIQFFGGEPLLNPALIESVCQYCEHLVESGQMEYLPGFGATSNGTIWNERVARVLKRYRIALNISVDGPQEVHDRSRVDVQGRGSFQRVFRTLQHLRAEGIPFSVETTYNVFTMRSGYSVWDIVRFLAENGIYHPHIVPAAYSRSDPERWTPQERRQLLEDYRTATRNALASLVEGQPLLFSFVTGILRSLLLKIPQPLVCAAGVHDLAIDTAGNLYPCFMFVGQTDFIQHSALQPLDDDAYRRRGHAFYAENLKSERASCRTCWARNICSSCIGANQIENGHLGGMTMNCLVIRAVGETLMTELARLQQSPARWKRFVENYRIFRLSNLEVRENC